MNKEEAVEKARKDLAQRLKVDAAEIKDSVEDADFPDMALGAAESDEMERTDDHARLAYPPLRRRSNLRIPRRQEPGSPL
jgi:hypothetical protein